MNTQRGIILPIIIIVLAAVGIGYYVFTREGAPLQPPMVNEPEPVACTMDAKLCPDGSYVGRQGPNCEFTACPTESNNQIVPVRVSYSTMNEATFALSGGVSVLGKTYLHLRNPQAIPADLFGPEPGSMGDNCSAYVEASFELANPSDGGRKTWQGYPAVDVDLVRVVSRGVPVKQCS